MTRPGVGRGERATAEAEAEAKAKAEVLRCVQNDKFFWWGEGEQETAETTARAKVGFFAALRTGSPQCGEGW
jgi:hypothetical protein